MPGKLGILAGAGSLPRLIADHCAASGRDFFVIGFRGHAQPADYAGLPFESVRLGAAGTLLAVLRREGVRDIVMAGGIRRPGLAELRPDVTALRFLMQSGALAMGDDGLLSAATRHLEEKYGFRIIGADSLLGQGVSAPGPLGVRIPDSQARQDMEKGRHVLAITGPADIGQAVAVQEGLVLGLEAVEGTDALLERCGRLRRSGPGPVLVKMRKPGQNRRVDLPAIGPDTLRAAAAAGFRGIGIDAGGMMFLDRAATCREADRLGLFLEALPPLEDVHDARR